MIVQFPTMYNDDCRSCYCRQYSTTVILWFSYQAILLRSLILYFWHELQWYLLLMIRQDIQVVAGSGDVNYLNITWIVSWLLLQSSRPVSSTNLLVHFNSQMGITTHKCSNCQHIFSKICVNFIFACNYTVGIQVYNNNNTNWQFDK